MRPSTKVTVPQLLRPGKLPAPLRVRLTEKELIHARMFQARRFWLNFRWTFQWWLHCIRLAQQTGEVKREAHAQRHLFLHLAQFDPIIASLDAGKPQPDDSLIRKLDQFDDLLNTTALERFKDWVPPLFTPEGVLDAEAVHALIFTHRRQWEGLSWEWLGWTTPTPFWEARGSAATSLHDGVQKKIVNRRQLIKNVGQELYAKLYWAYPPRRRIPARSDLDVSSPAGAIKRRLLELNTTRSCTKVLKLRRRILKHYFGKGEYAFVPKRDMDDETCTPLNRLLPLPVPLAPPPISDCCHRCQGLLERLREFDLGEPISVVRCINCGDYIYSH